MSTQSPSITYRQAVSISVDIQELMFEASAESLPDAVARILRNNGIRVQSRPAEESAP